MNIIQLMQVMQLLQNQENEYAEQWIREVYIVAAIMTGRMPIYRNSKNTSERS